MDILRKTAARATRQMARLSALVLMMLPLACAPALANSAGEAIRVIDRWAAAYNAQDGSAVLKLYAADAVLFGTARPLVFDGAKPIHASLQRFKREGRGVIVYLRDGTSGVPITAIPHEGDGRAEELRTRQWREIGLGAQILKDLGIASIRLLASTKRTYVGLAGFGIEILSTESID